MKINYVEGDATRPQGDGKKIIVHICNDVGAWGAGFVLAISRRWSEPEEHYCEAADNGRIALGAIELVKVEDDIWVANMIAQRGVGPIHGSPPIRYDALADCLMAVALNAKELGASIHMPRIGCGLAGGKWDKVEAVITATLGEIPVTVYDLPAR